MMHIRRWCVHRVATAQELAHILTERTSTLCSAFVVQRHDEYLFLNDATHEDGAGEWGILKANGSTHIQIESITFSWCRTAEALGLIEDALAGHMDHGGLALPVAVRLDTPEQHGRCRLCE
jgi:hypothetical protein